MMRGIRAPATMPASDTGTPMVSTPSTRPSSGSVTGAYARTDRPAGPVLETSAIVSPAATASTGRG